MGNHEGYRPSLTAALSGVHCEYARLGADDAVRAADDDDWAASHVEALADDWVERDVPPGEAQYFTIGLAWGGLHGLLREHGGLAVDVVQGGEALGVPGAIGHARLLPSADVATAAAFLTGTPFEELAPLYDAAVCDGCPDPTEHPPEERLDTLADAYEELGRFLTGAADAGDSVVLMLN
ncbi:YfbM family protein [Myceligenerans halotolerans]